MQQADFEELVRETAAGPPHWVQGVMHNIENLALNFGMGDHRVEELDCG